MQYLKKLLESGVLSDVSFSVGEEQEIFKAHKCILAVRSPVFLAMFDGSLKESSSTKEETRIQLPDSTPAAFKEFLDYIYHDEEIPLNEENWAPILYLADKYDLPQLKNMSVEFVREACDEDNLYGFYSEARRHGVLSHVNFIRFIMRHYTINSLNSNSFLLIHNNEILSEVISMDELDCDEIVVFRAAIRWASSKIPGEKKDGPELRRILGPALFAIRFPVIPASDFEEEVIPSGILYKQEIMNIFCKRNNLDEQISIEFPSHSRNHFNVTCIGSFGSFINIIDSNHCSIKFQVDKKLKIHKYALDICSEEGKIQLKSGNEILREENIGHKSTDIYDGYDYYSLDSPLIIEPHTPYTASIEFNSVDKVAKYKLNQAEEVNGVKWTFSDTNPEEGSIVGFRFSCLE